MNHGQSSKWDLLSYGKGQSVHLTRSQLFAEKPCSNQRSGLTIGNNSDMTRLSSEHAMPRSGGRYAGSSIKPDLPSPCLSGAYGTDLGPGDPHKRVCLYLYSRPHCPRSRSLAWYSFSHSCVGRCLVS
jgi:hypothetical protein